MLSSPLHSYGVKARVTPFLHRWKWRLHNNLLAVRRFSVAEKKLGPRQSSEFTPLAPCHTACLLEQGLWIQPLFPHHYSSALIASCLNLPTLLPSSPLVSFLSHTFLFIIFQTCHFPMLLGGFSHGSQFSNEVTNWTSNISVQFWHYLPDLSIRSIPQVKGSVHKTSLTSDVSCKCCATILLTNQL